jgi:hypothetical protein
LSKSKRLIFRKYGLTDATINQVNKHDIQFDIKDLMIFNKAGSLLLHKRLKPVSTMQSNFAEFNINNISNLIIHLYKNREMKNDLDNFSFEKFFFDKLKICILYKSGLIFAAISAVSTKTYLAKIYLLHIFTAFNNFMGGLVVPLKYVKKDEYSPKSSSETAKKLHSEFFQLQFFEV